MFFQIDGKLCTSCFCLEYEFINAGESLVVVPFTERESIRLFLKKNIYPWLFVSISDLMYIIVKIHVKQVSLLISCVACPTKRLSFFMDCLLIFYPVLVTLRTFILNFIYKSFVISTYVIIHIF